MLTALLLLASLIQPPIANEKGADWIQLDDGRKLTGRVVYAGADSVRIRPTRGEIDVERSRITSMQTLEISLGEFLARYEQVGKSDIGALSQLAQFCESRSLEHEAYNLWLRILLLDPAFDAALRGVGARRVHGLTQVRNGKKWVDLDEYRAPKARWRDAIEVRSTHFLCRSDLKLDVLLDTAVRAERHYQRFYQALGPPLGLYTFDDTPEIRIYSDIRDYPLPWTAAKLHSWFAPGVNTLHIHYDGAPDMGQLFHDATDLLLFNALRRSSGKTSQIPPWVTEGLSRYFAATAPTRPDEPWAPLGTPSPTAFRQVASDPKPPELKKLLRASRHELRSGPDWERFSAHVYAMVHYLVHADEGAHREAFAALVREAWRGKNIDAEFLSTFAPDADAFQSAIRAYARTISR